MADGSIHIDTHLDDSGLKSGIAKMKGTITSGFGALGSIAAKGLAAATAATVTFVGAATKAGIEFESAFAGVKKTVDALPEELDEIRIGILEMSKEIPLAATEIAGIAEAAGQLGIKTESLLGFTEVMANLGVATNMTAEEAATALARLANITQMPQDQFDRLGSTVVALGNNFATTESEIVDMALRLAGAGAQVGLTEAQILAFSTALSSVGIQAEMGGSAFSRVFKMMQLATETQGDALKAFATVAGMSASEFKRAFEEDAASAMVAFVTGLGNAEQHGMTAIGVLEKMSGIQELSAINTVAVSDALLRAAGSSNVMAEALGVASSAWQDNTALTNEAAQRYETLESKIQLLKNTANALMVTMSDSWRGTCAEFVSAGTQMIATLDAAFQSGGVNGLIQALGPVLEQAVSLILSYVPRFMEVAVQLLSGLASSLLNNLPLLTKAAIQVVSQLATGLISSLPQIASTGKEIIKILVSNIEPAARQLLTVGSKLISDLAQGALNAIPKITKVATDIISKLSSGVTSNSGKFITIALDLVEKFADQLIKNVPKLLSAGLDLMKSIVQGIANGLPTLIQRVPGIISKFASVINDNAPTVLKAGWDMLVTLGKGIINAIPTLVKNIPQIFKAIWDVWQAINWLQLGTKVITGLVNGIKSLFGSVGSVAKSLGDKLTSVFTALPNKFLDIGKNIISGLWSGIKGAFSSLTSKVTGLFSGLVSSIKSSLGIHSPSTLFRDVVGKNIGLGVKVGIERTQPNVSRAMNSLIDPKKATSRVSRMRASVRDHVVNMTNSAAEEAAHNAVPSRTDGYPSADAIADAIWDKAPPLEVDLDGEKLGTMIEPKVSKIQAKKTENMNRRNGYVPA